MNCVFKKTTSVAAFLGLAVAMCLSGCSEQWPADVGAQEVLDAGAATMEAMAGFHFVYELHQPESAEKADDVQKVDADMNAQGEMQGTAQRLTGGYLLTVDIVVMPDAHYFRLPGARTWGQYSPEESPLKNLDPAGLPVQVLREILDPVGVDIQTRQGHKSYHITGQVTAETVESIAGTVSTADLFETDLWIGVDDHILYEVDIHGPMTPNEIEGTFRSVIISNPGVAVDVEAPLEVEVPQ